MNIDKELIVNATKSCREGLVNEVIDSLEDTLKRELEESEIEHVETYVVNALSDAEFCSKT